MMSFYGLAIAVILLFCILQFSLIAHESRSVSTIGVSYRQIARYISASAGQKS